MFLGSSGAQHHASEGIAEEIPLVARSRQNYNMMASVPFLQSKAGATMTSRALVTAGGDNLSRSGYVKVSTMMSRDNHSRDQLSHSGREVVLTSSRTPEPDPEAPAVREEDPSIEATELATMTERIASRTSTASSGQEVTRSFRFRTADDELCLKPIKLLNNAKIRIDCEDAAIIMVFPRVAERVSSHGEGTAMILPPAENPLEQAKRILIRKKNPLSWFTMHFREDEESDNSERLRPKFEPLNVGEGSSVSSVEYMRIVREKILEILRDSGMTVSSFDSVDHDEVFLKISLDRQGKTIGSFAHRYGIKLPLKRSVYKNIQQDHDTDSATPGWEYIVNDNGHHVPAYAEYDEEKKELFREFGQLEEIRIIEHQLNDYLHTEKLKQQQVISKMFVAGSYNVVTKLNKTWANLRNFWRPPVYDNPPHFPEEVQKYFGEEVAFFFLWFSFYIHHLMWLAAIAAIFSIRTWSILDVPLSRQRYIQMAFAFIMVCWSSAFNRIFAMNASRYRQLWGVEDCDTTSSEQPNYNDDLEGTWKLSSRRIMARLLSFIFCILYMSVIFGFDIARTRYRAPACVMRVVSAVWIKVGSFLWGKLAPLMANLGNPRTRYRWNQELVGYLAYVKIFVALYPFINIAFIRKFKNRHCGATLREVAAHIFNMGWPSINGVSLEETWGFNSSWTANMTMEHFARNSSHLNFLRLYSYPMYNGAGSADDQVCVYGCFPQECFDGAGGALVCVTNCVKDLEGTLKAYVCVACLATISMMAIPIFLTYWRVKQERDSVHHPPVGDDEDDSESCSDVVPMEPYSFLQMQSKCYDEARYEHNSWGGSIVEDYMELAIQFSLITCFSVVLPGIVMIVVIMNCVQYRFLAFRMANVTCRPSPQSAEGIGAWASVLESVGQLAVRVNIAYTVLVMYPIRDYPLQWEAFYFIAFEQVLMFVREIIQSAIPDHPADVLRIKEFNERALRQFIRHKPLQLNGPIPALPADTGCADVCGHETAPMSFFG